MNYDTFLKLVQSLITMTDENDPASIATSKAILENLNNLIQASQMADGDVRMMAMRVPSMFDELISFKSDFAGSPGDIRKNRTKRHRLAMSILPHC